MSYYPEFQTALELTAGNHQITDSAAIMGALSIHLNDRASGEDKKPVWRLSDASTGIPPGDNPGVIFFAAFVDDPRVQAGSFITFPWPCKNGIFLEVPPGGVCSVCWVK